MGSWTDALLPNGKGPPHLNTSEQKVPRLSILRMLSSTQFRSIFARSLRCADANLYEAKTASRAGHRGPMGAHSGSSLRMEMAGAIHTQRGSEKGFGPAAPVKG